MEKVEEWLSSKRIARVSDEEERIWFESKATLWAVVVKPRVLVQEPSQGQLQ